MFLDAPCLHAGFCCVCQTLCSRSYPGAVSQEERKKGDGGERDPEYQETLCENGLQRPPQLQDNGTPQAVYLAFYFVKLAC